MERHRKNQAQPTSLCFEGSSEPSHASIPPQNRPTLDEDIDQPKSKRSKSGKPKSSKDKRAVKQSNKGLIGAVMTLSVVGMLNYVGNTGGAGECNTRFDQQNANIMPEDQFRDGYVQNAKNDYTATFGSGSMYIEEVREEEEQDPVIAMDLTLDNNDWQLNEFVPAKLDQTGTDMTEYGHPNTLLNTTATGSNGLTLEEAKMAFNMRESFIQRHVTPMSTMADATELSTKDFTTKSCNMWKSSDATDLSLYPELSNKQCDSANIY